MECLRNETVGATVCLAPTVALCILGVPQREFQCFRGTGRLKLLEY